MNQSTLDPTEKTHFLISSEEDIVNDNNNTNSQCPGCYPYFQPGQLAHMVEDGCLYRPNLESNYDLLSSPKIDTEKDPKN